VRGDNISIGSLTVIVRTGVGVTCVGDTRVTNPCALISRVPMTLSVRSPSIDLAGAGAVVLSFV